VERLPLLLVERPPPIEEVHPPANVQWLRELARSCGLLQGGVSLMYCAAPALVLALLLHCSEKSQVCSFCSLCHLSVLLPSIPRFFAKAIGCKANKLGCTQLQHYCTLQRPLCCGAAIIAVPGVLSSLCRRSQGSRCLRSSELHAELMNVTRLHNVGSRDVLGGGGTLLVVYTISTCTAHVSVRKAQRWCAM